MPDSRLDELHRQRALVQEHLAWLEREIQAEERSGKPREKTSPSPIASTGARAVADRPADTSARTDARAAGAGSAARSDAVADDILEQYRVPPASLQSDVRKGCWLYLVAALVGLALVVAVLYVAISRR